MRTLGSGTTPWEVLALTSTMPLALLLHALIPKNSLNRHFAEFCMYTFWLVSALTFASELYHMVMAFMALAAAYLWLKKARTAPKVVPSDKKEELLSDGKNRHPFLTNFRASVLLSTAVSILAVDFEAFPRRFAKTEDFGYGLMDAGVGTFVFMAGIVARESKLESVGSKFVESLPSTLPMLVMGLGRLALVTASGHEVNASEYGSHCNAFLLLFAVKVLSLAIFVLIPTRASLWVSTLLAFVQFGLLKWSPLQEWVLSESPRSGPMEANREGIVSLTGYLSIYVFGVFFGQVLRNLEDKSFQGYKTFLIKMASGSMAAFAPLALFNIEPSRRLANFGYVVWMLAFNLAVLSTFLAVDLLIVFFNKRYNPLNKGHHGKKERQSPFIEERVPRLFDSINRHGIFYFLFSNVLTGLVNQAVNASLMTPCPSVLIITAYIIVVNLITTHYMSPVNPNQRG